MLKEPELAKQEKSDISDAAKSVLVRLLAEQDAIYFPPRVSPLENAWSNWWAARREYLVKGMAWRSIGRSEAERKDGERAVGELVSARLIRRAKGISRTVSIILTDRGDAVARSLADVMGDVCAYQDCQKLLKAEKHPDWCYEDGWIAEIALTAGRGWNGDGHHQELDSADRCMIVPSIRGWVEMAMMMRGRVFYRLTDAGRAVAASKRLPAAIDDLPEPSERCEQVYWESLRSAIRTLTTSTAPSREIGCNIISGGLATLREMAEDGATATDVSI